MVCDENTMGETDIKIRFNRLCQQFKDNGKYICIEDFTIPDNEDISYEMSINNKRYEAIYYQLPEGEALDHLHETLLEQVKTRYTQEQIQNPSEETKAQILADTYSCLYDAVHNKPVWFIISELYGQYHITMFYDNEYNRANGQDL